jgi:SAM-dependent methyltransferase
MKPGDKHYKAFIGYPERWDTMAASQFNLLTSLGLREQSNLLDFGCGSLRAGRILINYLEEKRYIGVEPNKWLVEEGISKELSKEIVEKKKPSFHYFGDFKLSRINHSFDYIIAKSIFTHSDLNSIKIALSEVPRIMKSDSIFAATFILGKNDYSGPESWVYPGVVTYKFRTIKAVAKQNGLNCEFLNWKDPQNWLAFTKFDRPRATSHKIKKLNSVFHYSSLKYELLKQSKGLFVC